MKLFIKRYDIFIIIALFGFFLNANYFDAFSLLEDQTIAIRHLLRTELGSSEYTSFPKNQIVFVSVDDSFYKAYKGYPLKRSDLGKIIDNIKNLGAKVIVVDFLMDFPCAYREDDILALSLKNAGNTVIASRALFENNQFKRLQYPTESLKQVSKTGYVNMLSSNNMVTFLNRVRVYPTIALKYQEWPIAVQAISMYFDVTPKIDDHKLFIGDISISLDYYYDYIIDYSKVPKALHSIHDIWGISAYEFLSLDSKDPEELREISFWVKNKIVILGNASEFSNDVFDTPVGSMFSAEIIGESIKTLLNQAPLQKLSWEMQTVITGIFLFLIVMTCSLFKKSYSRAVIIFIVYFVFIYFCTFQYVSHGNVISMVYPMITGFFVYSILIFRFHQNEQKIKNEMAVKLLEKQKSLEKAEEKYRRIYMQAVEGIYQTTPAGRIISGNPALVKILGFESQEELCNTVVDIGKQCYVNPEDREKIRLILREYDKIEHYEAQFYTKDHNKIWVSISAKTVRDSNNVVQLYEGSLVDVTERKEQERIERELRAAEAANKAKSKFLAIVSHELKTPLNAILGMAELLEETKLDDEQTKYITLCRKSSEKLLELINDILELSSIEAGMMELEFKEMNIKLIVETIISNIKERTLEKKLELTFEVSPIIPEHLEGDPVQLRKILLHLLDNAIKFTDKGSIGISVTIPYSQDSFSKDSIEENSNLSVLFAVKDTGIGIQKDYHQSIFENFFQLDAFNTRKYSGSGLGLSLCKRLCEMMGGRIWLESELGKGATFYFSVPFKVLAKPPAIQTKPTEIQTIETKKMLEPKSMTPLNILLVEDHPNNQMVFMLYMEDTPHSIDIANDGKEGFEKYIANRYDIVFMDMQMPVMDGYEASQKIRQWEKENNKNPTPIIALTAHSMKAHNKTTGDAGCTYHLTKPINKSQLLEIIDKFSISLK